MTDEPPTERIHLPLSRQFIERIDDFRFARHMPSRAAAIRELIERGLELAEATSGRRKGKG